VLLPALPVLLVNTAMLAQDPAHFALLDKLVLLVHRLVHHVLLANIAALVQLVLLVLLVNIAVLVQHLARPVLLEHMLVLLDRLLAPTATLERILQQLVLLPPLLAHLAPLENTAVLALHPALLVLLGRMQIQSVQQYVHFVLLEHHHLQLVQQPLQNVFPVLLVNIHPLLDQQHAHHVLLVNLQVEQAQYHAHLVVLEHMLH